MKFEIIKIGKCRHAGVGELASEYVKRMRPFGSFTSIVLKERESETKLTRLLGSDSFIVCLDERGEQLSSLAFSDKIQTWMSDSYFKQIVFVIGGPYGVPEFFRNKSHFVWSLSECTLPSDISWLLVCEQLYRAFTILKGMAYHHE